MLTVLVACVVVLSAILLLILMVARFIQPEMLYAVRHTLVQVKTTKAFLDYFDRGFVRGKRFPDLLGDDLRFETRDSDEEDVLKRVGKIRELYRVQVLKHRVPGVKKFGKPQICIVELAGMLVNLGREVTPEKQFRYPVVDGERLLLFICNEIRRKNGEPPLNSVAEVEDWFTSHPISIEQVIEILIAAILGLSYRQRVQLKSSHEEKPIDEPKTDSGGAAGSAKSVSDESKNDLQPVETEKQTVNLPLRDLPVRNVPGDKTIRIFISYSHEDEKYLKPRSLVGALKGLKSEGVEFWTDRQIATGEKWDDEIRKRISESDIALVLVSQPYLDSPYCQNTEIKAFLKETETRGLVIFPVMLSRCEYERHEWLRTRQFMPRDGATIEQNYTNAGKRKDLFHEIRQHLRLQIDASRRRATQSPTNGNAPGDA